jgi:hypothetical protein
MDTIMADNDNFDMFKFGGLVNQVENLQAKVDSMDKDIKTLLELANRSKGSLWALMGIASLVGGFITYLTNVLFHK